MSLGRLASEAATNHWAKGALRVQRRRAADRHRHPRADLRRQVQDLLLEATQAHLLHQEIELIEV